jgi:tetratricopeptide (TPR) repeat protein
LPLTLNIRKDLQRGLGLLDACQTAEGLELLAGVAKSHETDGPARLFHGIALWDSGKADAAAEEFAATLQIQPGNTLAMSWLGLALAALGDWQKARQLWKPFGHHTNRGYRVRVSEWMEERFLKANGWPDALPKRPESKSISAGRETGLALEEQTEQFPKATDSGPEEERPDWVPGPYAPDSDEDFGLLSTDRIRLSWWTRSRLERRVAGHFQARRYEQVVQEAAPLLQDPRCDMVTLWVTATAAELTGRAGVARRLCERVTPRDYWPEPLRALYGRCLYRLGHHWEAAKIAAGVEIRGPEDYGMHWLLAGLALAQGDRALARQLFFRAHGQYMVDTIENQWWSVERALQRNES